MKNKKNKIKNNFFKSKIFKYFSIFLFLICGFGVFLRFQNLGYSTYQGDEINAIRFLKTYDGTPPSISEFPSFLLQQKRGAMQYVINFISISVFGNHQEFGIRLPFFIFGSLALVTFYLLAKKVFNKKVALLTASLMSLNGLYIAFSRITQYQSFMYLTVPVAVLMFIVGIQKKSLKIGIIAGVILSIDMIGHYDTLSVLPFMIASFFYFLFRKKIDKFLIKYFLIFKVSFLIPSLLFYVPFLTNQNFNSSTSGYLSSRLTGGESISFMPRLPESLKLITLYNTMQVYIIYFLLISVGLFTFYKTIKVDNNKLFKINFLTNKILKSFYLLCLAVFMFGVFFSYYPIKPRLSTLLVWSSSLGICALLILYSKSKFHRISLVCWYLGAFCVYFYFIRDPRTHVYVTFIPGFSVMGLGAYYLLKKYTYITVSFFSIFLLYTAFINYYVFVDKNPEYPWYHKKVHGIQLKKIDRNAWKKLDGVFGFNHQRPWKDFAKMYEAGCLKGKYNSNEKNSVTSFYLGFDQTSPELKDFIYNADTLLGVYGPHSWFYQRYKDPKPARYKLLKEYKMGDYSYAKIWGLKTTYQDKEFKCKL